MQHYFRNPMENYFYQKERTQNLLEELGIKVTKENIEYLYTVQEELIISEEYIERIFFDVFIARKDVEIKDVKIQEEELEEAKLMYYKDVEELVKTSDNMVPNQNDYEKIFKLI